MGRVLLLASIFDTAGVLWLLLHPASWHAVTGFPRPENAEVWQYTAMLALAVAAGYFIASRDPIRHWPIVFVGLVGKVLGPLSFIKAVNAGSAPLSSLWTIVIADIVWWLPFGLILTAAYNAHRAPQRSVSTEVLQLAMRTRTSSGLTLDELCLVQPVLLIFLRHAGCTFCREALHDIAKQRPAVEAAGAEIVLVHQGDPHRIRRLLFRYRLDDLVRIADQGQNLYRAFCLPRASPLMLLSPTLWWRGLQSAVIHRNGMGSVEGDPLQLPGIFVLFHGEVLRSYRHRGPADRPDYAGLVTEESPPQVLW